MAPQLPPARLALQECGGRRPVALRIAQGNAFYPDCASLCLYDPWRPEERGWSYDARARCFVPWAAARGQG